MDAVVPTLRTVSTVTATPTVATTTPTGRATRTSTVPARLSTPARSSRKFSPRRKGYAKDVSSQSLLTPGGKTVSLLSGLPERSSSSSSRTARRSSTPTRPGPVLRVTSLPMSGVRAPSLPSATSPASPRSVASPRWTRQHPQEWFWLCPSGMT